MYINLEFIFIALATIGLCVALIVNDLIDKIDYLQEQNAKLAREKAEAEYKGTIYIEYINLEK